VHELVEHLTRYGLPLVFLNVLLEQLGLPIPAFPTLMAAGALAALGRLPGWGLLAVAVAASLLADSTWFFLGRRHGYRVLKIICGISLSPDSCVRQTETHFERRGMRSLLVAKFIPGFSTVAPPLAGAVRARYAAFALYDGAGAVIWAGLAIALGVVFREAIDRVAEYLEGLGFWALVLAGGALLLFIAWKWWQRRRFFRVLRMARISPADLARLLESGAPPAVVDVRSRAAWQRDPRRVPGAVRLDLEEIDAKLGELPRDREIILYCT
jgi:membrane protein DedA with SNARE-associated domain